MSKSKSKQISKKQADKLSKRWTSALTRNLGNLFSYEQEGAIQRIDKYVLNEKFITKILDTYGGKKGNIQNISILMGLGEYDAYKPNTDPSPDKHLFQPILEVKLKDSYKKEATFYFTLCPIFESSYLNMCSKIIEREEINAKIAELFVLNWHSLTDNELMNAFEGLKSSGSQK